MAGARLMQGEHINFVLQAQKGADTNGLENFWSLLKRGLKGTYIAVEPFHMFRYLDEQVFRYNNRKLAHDGERFHCVMSHITGRRLTYEQLTGKGTDAVHQG